MKLEFLNVSKIHNRKRQTYDLNEVCTSFAEQKSVAILSVHERSSKSLLKLISGIEQPTRGSIIREGIFTSPIGDSSYFHREMSGEENIRFICKLYGQETNRVIHEIKEFAEIKKELKHKTKSYTPGLRRKIAISTSLLMKSNVYQLTDGLHHPQPKFNKKIQSKLMELATQSIIVVTAGNTDILQKYASYSMVIDHDGHLQSYNDVQSGIEAHKALKMDS
jgi:capsular polysaccharide transport system ATP-binding protein